MIFARPVAVFLCLMPFPFPWREKAFISWVGLRGAVGIFLASIPLLVHLPKAEIYFNIAFVVVLASLLIQGWSIGWAARLFHVALPRHDHMPRRVELDLPGQLEQEIVGYPVGPNSPYLRRGLLPSWARPTLVVRDQKILSPPEADPVRPGDYIYLLAPPEKAQALDRFFVNLPPPARPDPLLLGDFFVTGEHTLGELAEIYGLTVAEEEKAHDAGRSFRKRMDGACHAPATCCRSGEIALVVHQVTEGRVVSVGLRLAEVEPDEKPPSWRRRLKQAWRKLLARLG